LELFKLKKEAGMEMEYIGNKYPYINCENGSEHYQVEMCVKYMDEFSERRALTEKKLADFFSDNPRVKVGDSKKIFETSKSKAKRAMSLLDSHVAQGILNKWDKTTPMPFKDFLENEDYGAFLNELSVSKISGDEQKKAKKISELKEELSYYGRRAFVDINMIYTYDPQLDQPKGARLGKKADATSLFNKLTSSNKKEVTPVDYFNVLLGAEHSIDQEKLNNMTSLDSKIEKSEYTLDEEEKRLKKEILNFEKIKYVKKDIVENINVDDVVKDLGEISPLDAVHVALNHIEEKGENPIVLKEGLFNEDLTSKLNEYSCYVSRYEKGRNLAKKQDKLINDESAKTLSKNSVEILGMDKDTKSKLDMVINRFTKEGGKDFVKPSLSIDILLSGKKSR
jgi:hypothetical protein